MSITNTTTNQPDPDLFDLDSYLEDPAFAAAYEDVAMRGRHTAHSITSSHLLDHFCVNSDYRGDHWQCPPPALSPAGKPSCEVTGRELAGHPQPSVAADTDATLAEASPCGGCSFGLPRH